MIVLINYLYLLLMWCNVRSWIMGQQDMLSLHDIWNEAFLRHSRAVTAKKCTKKRDARVKLLFSVLLFWRSRSRRRREPNAALHK